MYVRGGEVTEYLLRRKIFSLWVRIANFISQNLRNVIELNCQAMVHVSCIMPDIYFFCQFDLCQRISPSMHSVTSSNRFFFK